MTYTQRPVRRQRVRYDDANDDNVLTYQFTIGSEKITPTSATITIYAPGSTTALVSAAAMTVSGSLLTYAVDTTTEASWPVGNGYRADIVVTYSSVTYPRHLIFDVVKYVLTLNCTRDTLLSIDSNILGMDHAGDDDFSAVIESCKDELQVLLEAKIIESKKLLKDMVLDYSGLELCLAYRVLSRVWRNAGNHDTANEYKENYEEMWQAITSSLLYDVNQDGTEDNKPGVIQAVRLVL